MGEIRLTDGSVALVDDGDVAMLSGFAWGRDRWGYARRGEGKKTILMHRQIAAALPGEEVDHANGVPLDNRRENLRKATRGQNARNTGPLSFRKHGQPFKGISRQRDGWKAQISPGKVQIYLGQFASPEEAARAYDRAALQHYGEFARLNFPRKRGAA